MKYLENDSILHESQHGFQHVRSYETQLILFTNDSCKTYDSGRCYIDGYSQSLRQSSHNRLRHVVDNIKHSKIRLFADDRPKKTGRAQT